MVLRKAILDQNVKNIEGEDEKFYIQDEKGGTILVSLTLRRAMKRAVAAAFRDETLDGEKVMERFELAERIFKIEDNLELSVNDIKIIKACILKNHTIETVGYINRVLEGKIS
jgi:hypothetical protein